VATPKQVISRLRNAELFKNLSRTQLEALASIVQQQGFDAGEIIYNQGEVGDRYYILHRGRLRYTRVDAEGKVLEQETLGPGNEFGHLCLLLGEMRQATVEVVEESIVLYLDREDFELFLDDHPRVEGLLNMDPEVAERRSYPEFKWLEEGEFPIKVLHRHVAVVIPRLMLTGAVAIALLATDIAAGVTWGVWAAAIGAFLTAIPILAFIYIYIDWSNDVYFVTNKRVCHQEREGLIRQQFASSPLHSVQTVSQVQAGPISSLLNYGDLVVEMTGEGAPIVFRDVPRPELVQQIIVERIDWQQAGARAQERAAIQEALRRRLRGGEEAEEAFEESEPVEEPEQARERPGCLTLFPRLFRSLLPPTWHREDHTVTWRKHWVALILPVAPPLILLFVITAVVLVVSVGLREEFVDDAPVVLALYSLGLLIVVPWLLWKYEDWQNDFYRVTATRLIHVEKLPFLLHEERRESPLDRITNVRYKQSIMGRILGYGDVFVETAAVTGDFELVMVHRPEQVQREIFSHMDEFEQRLKRQEIERRRMEMLEWFSVYDEIHQSRPRSPETGEFTTQ
jgi:CRP-like cAMP-binding protein